MSTTNQIACIECRQQKVRCLSSEEKGGPCQRCAKRHLECVVDNNYKRTIKRKRVESLEAEIDALKAQLERAKRAWSPTHATAVSALPPARFTTPPVPATVPPAPVKVAASSCAPKSTVAETTEAITLDSATIEILFTEYVTNYHPVMPVVEVSRGPEFIYNASEALFWTIMTIAARRRCADLGPGLDFDKLCAVQKQHLSNIAVSPVLYKGKSTEFNLPSVYAVQAFLLCTLYPPPTASINADMSWNTAGIAVLVALRAGLHCPGHQRDFERIFKSSKEHRSNISEQLVTWLGTNAITQVMANMFGYPSAVGFRSHTEYPFNNIDLPKRVRQMYEVQRIAHDVELSLGHMGQAATTSLDVTMVSSLIRIHASHYDNLESEEGRFMDARTLFSLYSGRVHLFSYYMLGNLTEEGALALYNSCLTLLNFTVAQDDQFIKYLPVVSIMILWQTASVVARLYHSRWSENLDKECGEQLFRTTIKKVGLASVVEHDLPYRAAEILTQMWAAFSSMRRNGHEKVLSARLTLKTRMAASVFFDNLWTMREVSEIRSKAPTQLTHKGSEQSKSDAQPGRRAVAQGAPTSAVPSQHAQRQQLHQQDPQQDPQQEQPSRRPSQQLGHHIPPPLQPLHHQQQQQQGFMEAQLQVQQPSQGIAPASPPVAMSVSAAAGHPRPPGAPPTSISSLLSPPDPMSPMVSQMDGTTVSPLAGLDDEAMSAIWQDVNSVMEDFGFGLGELPYVSPPGIH